MRKTVLFFVSFILALSVAASTPLKPEWAARGIQEGLRRSPDNYVAATFAIAGHKIKLINVFVSKPSRENGEMLPADVQGGDPVPDGTQYMGFLVPDEQGNFRATFLVSEVTPANSETFEKGLAMAGLGTQPSH